MPATSDSPKPTLVSFAVCDDIRPDERNKITLVGYYGRSIIVGTLPALLPKLSCIAQFEILPAGTRVQLTVLSPSGNTLMSAADLQISAEEQSSLLVPAQYKYTSIAFQVIPMPLAEEGPYRVDYTFNDGTSLHASFYVAVDPSAVKQTHSATARQEQVEQSR